MFASVNIANSGLVSIVKFVWPCLAQEIEAPTATARCRFEDAVACCRAAKELKAILHLLPSEKNLPAM